MPSSRNKNRTDPYILYSILYRDSAAAGFPGGEPAVFGSARRNAKEFEKIGKKVLTGRRECGIILEHQVRHERMTSESR